MEKTQTTKIEEKDINYNIYNALNLINENLGASYLSEGFNPFDEGFEMSEEFALDRYHNSCVKKEIISPDFINKGSKQTQKAFEKSVENLDALILNLDELLSDYTLDEKTKKQYENIRLYLVCRRQLTLIFISRLKKEKNTLKMFEELTFLDHELEEYCTDIFTEFYNIQNAINAFKQFAKNNKLSKEDKDLIQKAKDIIKRNQEKQASMSVQSTNKSSSASKVKLPTFASDAKKQKEESTEIKKETQSQKQPITQENQAAAQVPKTKAAQIIAPTQQPDKEQTPDEMLLKYQEFIKNRDLATSEPAQSKETTPPAKGNESENFTSKENQTER